MLTQQQLQIGYRRCKMKPIDRLSKVYNDEAANTLAAYIDGLVRKHSDRMTPEVTRQILNALEAHKPMQLRKIFNLADYKAKDGNNHLEPMRRFKRGEIDAGTYDYITRAMRLYNAARTYKDDVRQQLDSAALDTDNDGDVDKKDVSNIAKAITYRDLGRQFDDEISILNTLHGIKE